MSAYAVLLPLGLFVSILILAVALPAQMILLAVTLPFDRTRTVPGRFIRLVAVAISRTFPPWRLRVVGRWPGPGPYVVVSNHQSMLDVLLLSRLPHEMKWVAKESLFRVPWVGWMFTLAGDISVRRGDAESGSGALRKARRYLDRGMSVMIFPEGTRSRSGALQSFKSGAFRLALEAGVPILPVAVSGTAAGLPRGSSGVRPCRGVAQVLEPVSAAPGLDDAILLRDEVHRRITAALETA